MENRMTPSEKIYDIAIIGGGINGVAIARDASGRGLQTFLCEKDDFGSATSAWSSKLIHGGLRYLEFYEFNLVRKALKERDILVKLAPHMVREQRFILPYKPHLRPKWLIRTGLFLYDHLYPSKFLKKSKYVHLTSKFLKKNLSEGFEYSDAVVDDHRLVIELAIEAQNHGAAISSYTSCEKVIHIDGLWHVHLKDAEGQHKLVFAKHIVNATGPWADVFAKEKIDMKNAKSLKLVKGSHIVVPKLYTESNAYTFQEEDGRIVFTVPYLNHYTLVGTTEETHLGDPNSAIISKDELYDLTHVINQNFDEPLHRSDIVWHFSGVRPLLDETGKNNRTTSRDYHIERVVYGPNSLINIWGGKLTTHRILAEDVLKSLGFKDAWTSKIPFSSAVSAEHFAHEMVHKYNFIDPEIVERYVHAYGRRCLTLLKNVKHLDDLGQYFGHGLYEKEVLFLIKYEWAKTPESILWFRTKCGVGMTPEQVHTFSESFNILVKDDQI
jgi:glycerol-3-phosphate dehydrogenase